MNELWYAQHENILLLVRWAAYYEYTAEEIVGIVEKPWNWKTEFEAARQWADAEASEVY